VAGEAPNGRPRDSQPLWLELPDGGRVILHLADGTPVGEVDAPAGFEWHPADPSARPAGSSVTEELATAVAIESGHRENDPDFGGAHDDGGWRPVQQRAAIHLPLAEGQLYKATLTLRTPPNLEPDTSHLIRLYQRRQRVITGGVFLQVDIRARHKPTTEPKRRTPSKRRTRATVGARGGSGKGK